METLLTREEAAKRLGIAVSTLDNERMRGNLAYIQHRPNGKVWITEDAIRRYLERGTHQEKPLRMNVTTYRKRRTS